MLVEQCQQRFKYLRPVPHWLDHFLRELRTACAARSITSVQLTAVFDRHTASTLAVHPMY